MKTYYYPNKKEWTKLCTRPSSDTSKIYEAVVPILEQVKKEGDTALKKFNLLFDQANTPNLKVRKNEIEKAIQRTPKKLQEAIQIAKANIEKFHEAQKTNPLKVVTMNGVTCFRKSIPIQKVGLYIPGGTAPLFSTILMLAIPAKLAGCQDIILCTPPNKKGKIHPYILFTAQLLGIKKICKVGGAQAIAAMAYGTNSIPKVDKIFGPGNQYVTVAKQIIQQEGTGIDMPAGPSEVLVICDKKCNPSFVASDLLSQAEHGTDSQVILVSDDETIEFKIRKELKKQLEKLPRKKIAEGALKNSRIIITKNLEEAMDFSNAYAPEHLIIATEKYNDLAQKVINAGSVFLGKYTCESAGDYASGTNHTLPTSGFANSYSGVSIDSFYKKITFQKITKEGIKNIGPVIETMATAEGLEAHKNAVTIRLEYLKK